MSAPYTKVGLKRVPPRVERDTPEGKFWKKFRNPVNHQLNSNISTISFCPTRPHDFAVTASTKVTIYSASTGQVKKTISRFGDNAYSGTFRNDGKLLVAGGEEPILKVFDLSSRAILRQYSGHDRAIHVAQFSTDRVRALSCSDDKTAKLWDILGTSSTPLQTFSGHTDYVRCAAMNPASPDLFATGSLDHTVRMWDARAEGKSACVMRLQHAEPVRACLVLPGGNVAFTAAGSTMYAWDLLAGGKQLHSFSNHQKTITSLAMDGAGSRVLSSSLDGLVKIYDVATYGVTHGLRYNVPLTNVALSPDDKLLVTGSYDGVVCIRRRSEKGGEGEGAEDDPFGEMTAGGPRGGTRAYFERGFAAQPSADSFKVELKKKAKLKPYDKALRGFNYKQALDEALETRQPLIIVSMLEELGRREGLTIALSGRDEAGLEPLLSFLVKYVCVPALATTLIDTCNRVLELYAAVLGSCVVVDELFLKLRQKLQGELKVQKSLLEMVGVLDTVLAVPALSGSRKRHKTEHGGAEGGAEVILDADAAASADADADDADDA